MRGRILVSRVPEIAAMTACAQFVISMAPSIHGPDFEGAWCVYMV